MGSGLIDDGALSVLAQFVRVVVYTKGALGKVQWADAGGEGNRDQQTGYAPSTSKTRREGKQERATWNQLQLLLPWRARMPQGKEQLCKGCQPITPPPGRVPLIDPRHCGMAARNNLALAASCLPTDASLAAPVSRAQASQPVLFVAGSINNAMGD